MFKRKLKLLMALFMAGIMFLGLSGTNDFNSHSAAKAEDISVVPKSKPTGNSVDLGFITLISGYSLQPTSQFTYIGQPVNLNVAISFNALDAAGSIVYPWYNRQWYSSTNPTSSSNWSKVSGGTSNKLTVTPTQVGTVYYQDSYVKSGLLLGKSFYSDVATVTTYPDPVDATSVSVDVDDDYLYNNQAEATTTYAHATPDPYNSTAKLSWSVDNTDLATIDPTSGLITANKKGLSGTVHAIATLTNSDGDTVQGSEKVKIGGGLDDQTVNEGQTATLKILGNWSTVNSITWYHVVDGKETAISGANEMSYTTPATTFDNDKDQYYAVLKVPSQDSNGNDTVTTVTTNKANLTVIANTDPKITSVNNIYNNSYDDHNEDNTVVNGVIDSDNLTVRGSFTDNNKNSVMKSAAIQVKLPNNIKSDPEVATPDVTGVKVDGQETENYYIGPGPSGTDQYVYLFGIDYSANKTHTYEFSFVVDGNSNDQFLMTPELKGQDENEKDIEGIFSGNTLTINFSDNKLQGKANDIDYGALKYSNIGKPVAGTINGQNTADILSVSDNRRQKNQAQIYLSQTVPFTSGNGTKLPSELRFYSADGTYQELSSDGILIADTPAGNSVNSIENSSDIGLKLFIYNTAVKNEQYSSTLNWTIQNAPQ